MLEISAPCIALDFLNASRVSYHLSFRSLATGWHKVRCLHALKWH